MRGVAFIGGEGPEAGRCGPLAAGADLTAAADSGLMAAEAAGLRPQWIVGDMDSLDDPRRLDKYPPERVIRHRSDKDYTDTELVLRLLWDKGCDEIWLIGGGGGRTDHLFAIRSLFERDRAPDRWITAAEDIRCLKAGAVFEFSPGGEIPPAPGNDPGRAVSVFPLGAGPWRAVSSGLKWPLDGLVWDRGFFGISNYAAGAFSIRAAAGRFMVILPWEPQK